MRLDKFNNPIFNSTDIFNLLYEGKLEALPEIIVDNSNEIIELEKMSGINFINSEDLPSYSSIEEYDSVNQCSWYIPPTYLNFDIKQFCLSKCTSTLETARIMEEMSEFEKRNMIPILQWMKYFVDIATENNILWGVGRGSSVSSFVLYIIGVHRIHSIKYNLDWREFLR